MAYSKTVWEDNTAPYLNATNLNKIEGGISDNSIDIGANEDAIAQNISDVADLRVDVDLNTENILGLATGEIYQGTWTPTAPAEYPTAPEEGFSWYINDVADGGYTFTGGDLVGRVANNGDKIIWNGTAWSMVDNCNVRDDFYIADDIASMLSITAPLEGARCEVQGYYIANDGGGGSFNYDSTQSGTNNGGTILDGWVRQYTDAVYIVWFGAKGDGITDDTTAIQSAFNVSNKVIFERSKTYYISSTLTLVGDDINIDFNDSTILHNVDRSEYSITVIGEIATTTYNTAITKNDKAMDIGAVPDNSISYLIANELDENWVNNRDAYVKGEFIKYITNGELEVPFRDSYIAGSTINTLINKNVILKNLTITRDLITDIRCIIVQKYSNVLLQNVTVNRAHSTGIGISNCYNASIVDCVVDNYEISNDGYGLATSSSENVKVSRGTFTANRHGISSGGSDKAYPNRNFLYQGATINSISTIQSLDSHANMDGLIVSDCFIMNGANLGGINLNVNNCKINTKNSTRGIYIIPTKTSDNLVNISNCSIENNSATNQGFQGILINGQVPTGTLPEIEVLMGNINIDNCTIVDNVGGSTGECLLIAGIAPLTKVRNVSVTNTYMKAVSTQTWNTILMQLDENARVVFNNLNMDNLTSAKPFSFYTRSGADEESIKVTFSNSKIVTDGIGAVNNLRSAFYYCEFIGLGVASRLIYNSGATGIKLIGCTFKGFTSGGVSSDNWVYGQAKDCTIDTAIVLMNGVNANVHYSDLNSLTDNKITYGVRIPNVATGVAKVGDMVYNNGGFVAGGTLGWVCTVGGSPGTWKAFGTIEA